MSAVSVQPLQNVLNAAARIILCKQKFDSITADVRDRSHWLPVLQRIEYKVCALINKCLHQAALTYLTELCLRLTVNQSIVVTSVLPRGATL